MDVHLLRSRAAADQVAALINRVYATAEDGLWRDGATRTTAAAVAELIAADEIMVAEQGGTIVGSIHVHDVADDTSEFGLLVAAPEHRGTGIGRALVAFAEEHARRRGHRTMQLELLVPQSGEQPQKEFLKAWYGGCGYRVARRGRFEDAYPQLAPLLATPCELLIFEKPLVLG